jgi:hypothetical protein
MTPEEHAPVRSVEVRADWRARKWARNRMATRCDEDRFPEVAEAYRRGDRDEFLRDDIEAYRAGAAESADREEELEARVAELEAALKDSVTAMRLLLDAVQKHNAESDTFLSGFPLHLLSIEIAAACALLKDGDQ